MQKYDVPRNDLFRFFQIRDYIKKRTSLLTDFNISNTEKGIFCNVGNTSIKVFYNILMGSTAAGSKELRQTWEKELGIQIIENMLENIWNNAKKTSVCNRTRAVQLILQQPYT